MFFLRSLNPGGIELPVDLVAQRQQFSVVGHPLQSLLDQGATVFQRAGLLLLTGLGEQLVGFRTPLGGGIHLGGSDGRSEDDGRGGRRWLPEPVKIAATRQRQPGQRRGQRAGFPPAPPRWRASRTRRGGDWNGKPHGFEGNRREGFRVIQRRDELLAGLETLVGVLVQQFIQHRLIAVQRRRQLGRRRGHMHHRQREAVIGDVRRIAGEHFVEQHAKAVQVGASIHRLATNLFRTHVARRAERQAGAGHDRAAAEALGDAKIGEHWAAIFTEQDILRLDVAVDDAAMVGVMQGAGDGPGDVQAFVERQAGADVVLQGLAGQILHGQVVGALVGGDVIDGDDVRVAELGDDPTFVQEALGEFIVRGEDGLNDLQRDMAIERFLYGQINNRHTALAKFALDPIAWNVHV